MSAEKFVRVENYNQKNGLHAMYNRNPMCGRMGLSVEKAEEIYERFDVYNSLPDYEPHYNTPPSTLNPVITKHSPNSISYMIWGMVPIWETKKEKPRALANATSEKVDTTWKKPFMERRCLIPATHYFEWDRKTNPKTPFLFRLKGGELFGFAGIYNEWKDPKTGKDVQGYAILTTTPNELQKPIHHRMPVIIKREDEEEYLNPDTTEIEHLVHLLKPYPAGEMEMYQVSPAVNIPKNDSPRIIKPLTEGRGQNDKNERTKKSK